MGWFSGKPTLRNYDFEFIHQIGMALNNNHYHGVSDGGGIVSNVHFENCRFSREVTEKVSFLDCTYSDCEWNVNSWDF